MLSVAFATSTGSIDTRRVEFDTTGATFSPRIELDTATYPLATATWVTDTGDTYTGATPTIDFVASGAHTVSLSVSPRAALQVINLGYGADDGGDTSTVIPELFVVHPAQLVSAIRNLDLYQSTLLGLAFSRTAIASVDLRGFTALRRIENFNDDGDPTVGALRALWVSGCSSLQRLCVERAYLDGNDEAGWTAFDLTGCAALEDLRGAYALPTGIIFPETCQYLWHVCIRENPNLGPGSIPWAGMPVLTQLLINGTGQTGAIDLSMLPENAMIWFGGNPGIASILLPPRVGILLLYGCGLSQALVDSVLAALVAQDHPAGWSGWEIDLSSNAVPSAQGIADAATLLASTWPVPANEWGYHTVTVDTAA
jgi:hypothetical protein